MPDRVVTLLKTRIFWVERVEAAMSQGTAQTREIVRHPGAVTIVPMVDESNVCLIRNDRVSVKKTLIELPAGTLEPGENPRATAERELIEETGYRAGQMENVSGFFMSPGILDERMHLFRATDLESGAPRREPGEQIENLIVSWSEALSMIDRGEIEDAKTIVGLLYCERLRRST